MGCLSRHHGGVFIAGTDRWKVVLVEPEALRIALYVRDAAGLDPATVPPIPPADPPTQWWPVWSRRPVEVPESRGVRLLGGRDLDLAVASTQWARWWRHALEARPAPSTTCDRRSSLRWRASRTCARCCSGTTTTPRIWSEGLNGDPRVKSAHTAPGSGAERVGQGSAEDPRTSRPRLRDAGHGRSGCRPSSVDPAPDHLLLTRHLIADLDNALDWLRPRILALA